MIYYILSFSNVTTCDSLVCVVAQSNGSVSTFKPTDMIRHIDAPKVAFAASLGGNGLQKTTTGNVDLIYRVLLTNVGGAYNAETGRSKSFVHNVHSTDVKH